MLSSLRSLVGVSLAILVVGVTTSTVLGLAMADSEPADKTNQPTETSINQPSSLGQSTIEVQPATGKPAPLSGYKLQGTPASTVEQQAKGNLQQPQTSDQLQPNAKIPDFPNAN